MLEDIFSISVCFDPFVGSYITICWKFILLNSIWYVKIVVNWVNSEIICLLIHRLSCTESRNHIIKQSPYIWIPLVYLRKRLVQTTYGRFLCTPSGFFSVTVNTVTNILQEFRRVRENKWSLCKKKVGKNLKQVMFL